MTRVGMKVEMMQYISLELLLYQMKSPRNCTTEEVNVVKTTNNRRYKYDPYIKLFLIYEDCSEIIETVRGFFSKFATHLLHS